MALRVWGENLDPEEVTRTLGVEPTQVVRAGEVTSAGRLTRKSMWGFETDPPIEGHWPSLEDALTALLQVFEGEVEVIRRLQEQFKVILWCAHFSSSFDGGPTFSALLLKRLGDFGVELYLDTYHSEELTQLS